VVQFPELIKNAIQGLTKLPGVGEKTAMRMVLTMSKWKSSELEMVGQSISSLRNLSSCEDCGMYCDDKLCSICNDSFRQQTKSLCVVENVTDLMAIEKSGQFNGVYHVLGGVLNPLLGIGPDELRLDEIKSKIIEREIRDVILAVNPSVEGDATCSYFKMFLPSQVNIERIGFGIPIGGHLEYLDPLTISKALENRKRF